MDELKEKLTSAYRDIQVLEESFDVLAEEHSEEMAERLQEAAMMTELKLEMQQVHQLKVFKKYREFFEDGKKKLEQKYSVGPCPLVHLFFCVCVCVCPSPCGLTWPCERACAGLAQRRGPGDTVVQEPSAGLGTAGRGSQGSAHVLVILLSFPFSLSLHFFFSVHFLRPLLPPVLKPQQERKHNARLSIDSGQQ